MNHDHEPFATMHEFQPECERAIRSWWPARKTPSRKSENNEAREFGALSELKHAVGAPSRLA